MDDGEIAHLLALVHNKTRKCPMVCPLFSPRLSVISTTASRKSSFRQEICPCEELLILFTHDTNSVIMWNTGCVSNEFTYGRRFLGRSMSFGPVELQ